MGKRTGPNIANQNQKQAPGAGSGHMSNLKGKQQQSIKHRDGSFSGNKNHIESANKMHNHNFMNKSIMQNTYTHPEPNQNSHASNASHDLDQL